jgi:hypothetical protein
MAPFVGDSLTATNCAACASRAYGRFSHAAVTPLVQLDERNWLLELFHGPTLAFKDVALQLLGLLFERFPLDARHASDGGRCDQRRHRIGGDRRAGRPRQGRSLHASSARPRVRRAAPADDDGAVAQRPQYRDRGQLRRCAGAGEGDVRRSERLPAALPVGGQFDQLGAADGAGRLLFLRGGAAGRARAAGRLLGADRQFRRCVRRLCRRARWVCRSRS